MRYALVTNGIVDNIIEADDVFVSLINGLYDVVASDTAGVGDSYSNGVFTPQTPVVAPVRELSKVEYLKRFTQSERIAIRSTATNNATVNDYIELLNASSVVNLDDADTIAGVNSLESAGLLVAGRASEILA